MRGTALTIEITALGLVGGFVLGVAAGIARAGHVRLAGLIASAYVALIRGTPLVVQVMFIYFALPLAVGLRIDPMSAAVGAIAINAGAYIAEVVRGAIVSVDRGLIEAGLALGVSPRRVLATVVWPIAFRRMLPALGNQFIISLKDTSILIVIGVGELTRRGQEIIATNFRAMEIWSAVAIIYLILTATLALVLRLVEKRMRIL
ncbi:MAG: ABC transporter permease subunit [Phyllobacteriaceae bacterium]|nr:ABC transporter permease subunit [Phyllobacteriaceae bacterium]